MPQASAQLLLPQNIIPSARICWCYIKTWNSLPKKRIQGPFFFAKISLWIEFHRAVLGILEAPLLPISGLLEWIWPWKECCHSFGFCPLECHAVVSPQFIAPRNPKADLSHTVLPLVHVTLWMNTPRAWRVKVLLGLRRSIEDIESYQRPFWRSLMMLRKLKKLEGLKEGNVVLVLL